MPEDTVTASDIARLARVSRAAVSNWRRRHPGFPRPVGGTPTSPVFSQAEVEAWLREEGKLDEVPPEERTWRLLRAVGDEPEIGAVLRLVGDHQRTGTPIGDLGDRTAARRLGIDQDLVPLLRAVDALSGAWGAARAFDFLLERYLEVRLPRPSLTSPRLAALMAELVGPSARSVLDAACGIGALLSALPDARELFGQERDGALAGLAGTRLALHGTPADIRVGDSLRQDAFTGLTVDAVVCDPPFNDRYWGYEDLTADPRWEYGLPPRMEPELAWAQHALAHLDPGGLAVMLMPPAVAGRRSGRRVRTQLLRRGALRAVIVLTGGPHLWLLRRPSPGDRPPTLLLMDGADDTAIVPTWRQFEAGGDVDRPGTSRAVPIIDLLDEEVDLTPARHLSTPAGEQTAERLVRTRDRLAALLGRMADLVPDVEPPRDSGDLTVTSVAELARIGAVTVHRAAARGDTDASGAGRPLLTAEDVVEGREPTGRVVPPGPDWTLTRSGDIVVTVVSRRFAARVIETDGLVLGPHLYLVRADPEMFDPYFLAGVLGSTANVRSSAHASTGSRVDVHRARVPRLPLDEQRRYGEAFRRMDRFASAARDGVALGEELARLLADTVAEAGD